MSTRDQLVQELLKLPAADRAAAARALLESLEPAGDPAAPAPIDDTAARHEDTAPVGRRRRPRDTF